jgi:hypothetical protein
MLLGVAVASADILWADLDLNLSEIQQTVDRGVVAADTDLTFTVPVYVQTTGGANTTYPVHVQGTKAAGSTYAGGISVSGSPITAGGVANAQQVTVSWKTPSAEATDRTYSFTVEFEGRDSAGNPSPKLNDNNAWVRVSFTVAGSDTTPPEITVPADITEEATGPAGAVVTFAASAYDIVDGDVAVTVTPASGSTFALGTTEVKVEATDAAGNYASKTFNVTVEDTTPPEITVPADVFAYATSSGGAIVTFTASATDLVDGSVAVTYSKDPGTLFQLGPTTVTVTATDKAGNTATKDFKVTVEYKFDGFFQPIDNNGVYNKVKAGTAIPVKFSLHGDFGLFIMAAGYPRATTVPKSVMATTAALEEIVTASVSGLRYDPLADQYIYVWKTEKGWTGCKRLDVMLIDGTTHSALFEFVK